MADPTPTSAGTVAVRSEVQRDEFVETFTMREGDTRTQVAVNAVANKALMQLNVAKLRALVERAHMKSLPSVSRWTRQLLKPVKVR